jgi:hypothetical protein
MSDGVRSRLAAIIATMAEAMSVREVVVTSFCTRRAAAAKEAIQFFPDHQGDDRRIAPRRSLAR